VIWDPQAFRECQERGASLAHLGLKGTEGPSVRKAQRVRLEMTARGVLQVPLAQLDPQGPVVKRENLDPKDQAVLQDPEEPLEIEVTLVPSVP